MKKIILAIFIITCSSNLGCTGSKTQGNFTTRTPKASQETFANQAVSLIHDRGTPTKTIFHFAHSTSDPFGRRLTNQLTKSGYGVIQHRGERSKGETMIGYILDEVESGVVRLTLMLDAELYSQIYVIDADRTIKASPWVHQEKTETNSPQRSATQR